MAHPQSVSSAVIRIQPLVLKLPNHNMSSLGRFFGTIAAFCGRYPVENRSYVTTVTSAAELFMLTNSSVLA